jgi:opacity protein-like surface antigen
MKKIKFSLVTLLLMGGFGHAGGDISPVTIYETEDEVVSEEAYAEEYIDEPVVEEPIYIAPEPVIEEPVYVEPKPVVTPKVPPVVPPKPKNIKSNGFYAGLGITGVKYDSGCKCKKQKTDETTYGGVARVGYDFNQYVGVEARASRTNGDSDVKHMGIYLKPMLPVSDSANIYGLIGAAKTKIEGKLPDIDSDSLALGAGVEVDLSADIPRDGRYSRSFDGQGDQEKGLGLFVDYERMIVKKDAPDVDAVSAGVTYDF